MKKLKTKEMETKEEYDKMLQINKFEPEYPTRKERRLRYLSALTGKEKKYWEDLQSKQLFVISKEKQNEGVDLQG